MSWIGAGKDHVSVIGQLPGIATPFNALYASLWSQPHLPAEVLELCRLRLAQLHRCEVELRRSEVEIPTKQREQLVDWNSADCFSEADRACLSFAEVYAMDTQALTDEHATAVKRHFGEAGLVLLVEALGILDGMIRLSLLWQLTVQPDELPRQENTGAAQ